MMNTTSAPDRSSLLSHQEPSAIVILISFIIAAFAVFLNCFEIRFIAKRFRKATDFELVLLNLAFADLLSGIDYVIMTSINTYAHYNDQHAILKHLAWIFSLVLFASASSTTFVIVIGLERFFAVKRPLKHRIDHAGRSKLLRCILGTWAFNVIITVLVILVDYLTFPSGNDVYTGSRALGYVCASFLCLGLLIIIVLYSWLGYLVLMRSVKLLHFDKKDVAINAKLMRRAIKKERATISACTLVLLSFLVCNLPLVVRLFNGRLDPVSVILVKLNAVCNPLVYFFKGYLEKRYAKKNQGMSAEILKENMSKHQPKGSKDRAGVAKEKGQGAKQGSKGEKDSVSGSEDREVVSNDHVCGINVINCHKDGPLDEEVTNLNDPGERSEVNGISDAIINNNSIDALAMEQIVRQEKGVVNHGLEEQVNTDN